jgi:SPP1 gp7 family putative phage head morphogenesis protein
MTTSQRLRRPDPMTRTVKSDPTKSTRRIIRYEKALVSLMQKFKREARTVVKAGYARKQFAIPESVMSDMISFLNIAAIADDIAEAGEGVIVRLITEAYRGGVTFGSMQLIMPPAARLNENTNIALLIQKNNTLFTGITEDVSTDIQRVISDGVIKEKPLYQIVEEIEDRFGVGISRAKTMARTEIMTAVNQGAIDEYRAAGVEELEWLAALDEQMCDTCGALHGKRWPITSAPDCPAHPRCRCCLVPVILK